MRRFFRDLLTSLDMLVEALLVFPLAMAWAVARLSVQAMKAVVHILCNEPFSASQLICDAKDSLPV